MSAQLGSSIALRHPDTHRVWRIFEIPPPFDDIHQLATPPSLRTPSSLMMTETTLTRLVSKLTRMRGAALKV